MSKRHQPYSSNYQPAVPKPKSDLVDEDLSIEAAMAASQVTRSLINEAGIGRQNKIGTRRDN